VIEKERKNEKRTMKKTHRAQGRKGRNLKQDPSLTFIPCARDGKRGRANGG
jgi:hypothetical protein